MTSPTNHPQSGTLSFDALTSADLRAAAEALKAWETVRGWRKRTDATDESASVTWGFASDCPGYQEVRAEVGAIIGERLGELICDALDRIELRARRAFSAATQPNEPDHA